MLHFLNCVCCFSWLTKHSKLGPQSSFSESLIWQTLSDNFFGEDQENTLLLLFVRLVSEAQETEYLENFMSRGFRSSSSATLVTIWLNYMDSPWSHKVNVFRLEFWKDFEYVRYSDSSPNIYITWLHSDWLWVWT